MPNCLSTSQHRIYADDTNLTFASNDITHLEQGLNEDLAKVNEWLVANKLTLNKSKTEFMSIGSRQKLSTFSRSPSITIDGGVIIQVAYTKSLGVYIDENLLWSLHIDKIS